MKEKKQWITGIIILVATILIYSLSYCIVKIDSETKENRRIVIIDLTKSKKVQNCLIDVALIYDKEYNLKCEAKGIVEEDCKLSKAEELVLEKELWKNREKCYNKLNRGHLLKL